MALNIKTEVFGLEESNSIVHLSTDEDEDDCEIANNLHVPEGKPPERPRTPETHCSICLDELSNRCYTDSCWHMFCFECLKRWSTIEPSCPLCKKNFKTIYHTFTDQGLHETYEVPLPEIPSSPRIFLRSFADVNNISAEVNNRIFRMNVFLDIVRQNNRAIRANRAINYNTYNIDEDYNHNDNIQFHNARLMNMTNSYNLLPFTLRTYISPGDTMRARVYNNNVWAEPLPDASGRFRDCSSAYYRANPAQTYRLFGFIYREIIAMRSLTYASVSLGSLENNENELTNLILRMISQYGIRDSATINLLRPYTGVFTEHFVHEVYNFANSPYDMIGYDHNVRYSSRDDHSMTNHLPLEQYDTVNLPLGIPIPNIFDSNDETIVLDSEEDEDIMEIRPQQNYINDIIELSSSNDSDVEIVAQTFHPPVQPYNFLRDQPSTSTGIRDSLDRPNTRYNLRRRLATETPGCSFQMRHRLGYPPRRDVSNVDNYISSSTDDEPTITSTTFSSSRPVHMKSDVMLGRRKRRVKKSKSKKKPRNDDSQPSNMFGSSRSRSNSSSSSSSGDTDTRPNNDHMSVHTNVAL